MDPVRVPPFDVVRLTNRDDTFYDVMGPWLARREIVAELGDMMWDDDTKEWFVAMTADGLAGCVAVQPKADAIHVCSFYVDQPHRKNVIGSTLLVRVLMAYGETPMTATATPMAVELFGDCGFKAEGMRGKFTLMRREP